MDFLIERKAGRPIINKTRDSFIMSLAAEGKTYTEIAGTFKISRQRVAKIVRNNLTK